MFSRFFIEHPIFATVVSLVIVIAGGVSMVLLPVEQYPTITPVQVTVSATYPGADSQTVADSVAAPIEAQINGVDNMLYMTSTSSSNGQLQLTVYFSLNTDPDIAQVQVQNRVNLATPQLPEAVTQLGVSVQKKSSSIMMLIAVYGKDERYGANYIANYANVYVLDRVKRVPGAGQAQIMGVPDQAMRIWMNPDRMASLGITTSDIQQAVASQNQLFGAGQIGQEPTAGPVQLTFPVVTQRPFKDPAQYDNIILRASQDGSAIVRLKDVARVGDRPEAVHRRQQAQRRSRDVHRRLSAARRQRPAGIRGGPQGHGGDEIPLSRRNRLHDFARHDRLRAHFDRRGEEDALRGGTARRARGLSLPSELPGHRHLHRGHLRRPGRDLRRHDHAGVLHQPPDPLRPDISHRHRRGRCHRGRGKRGEEHVRVSPVAEGGHHPGDGGGDKPGHRDGARHVLRFHLGRLPSRDDGAALQAVRHHHRHLGGDLRFRGPHPDAGHVRRSAPAQGAPRAGLLREVQPLVCQFHRCLRPRGAARDPADDRRLRASGRAWSTPSFTSSWCFPRASSRTRTRGT